MIQELGVVNLVLYILSGVLVIVPGTVAIIIFRDSPKSAPQPPVAPATFQGYLRRDHRQGLEQPLELWTLTAAIPGHPVNSTVSRQTLEQAGYAVPLPPLTVRSS